ncbi:hypothetical protein F511_01563, partial [Dorcoceras hygrometricum]
AYLIYCSMENKQIHISCLDEDYLDVTSDLAKVLIGQDRAAPVLFKNQGIFYMITSGCSSLAANEAAPFVIPMPPGSPLGSYVFMADRWNTADLRDSRYLWLPLTVIPTQPTCFDCINMESLMRFNFSLNLLLILIFKI